MPETQPDAPAEGTRDRTVLLAAKTPVTARVFG